MPLFNFVADVFTAFIYAEPFTHLLFTFKALEEYS